MFYCHFFNQFIFIFCLINFFTGSKPLNDSVSHLVFGLFWFLPLMLVSCLDVRKLYLYNCISRISRFEVCLMLHTLMLECNRSAPHSLTLLKPYDYFKPFFPPPRMCNWNYLFFHLKCILHLVCVRGRPIWVFLWQMPIFRNQGGRYMMPIFLADILYFFLYLIKSKSSDT